MKLYLFGGAEVDLLSRSVSILKNLIRETFLKIQPKSILHVPFARTKFVPEDKGEWDEGWFTKLMNDTKIKIFDARSVSDTNSFVGKTIFINGGPERKILIETVSKNKKLMSLILNSKFIVAESAGSMAVGEYLRISRTSNEIIKGLGLLKNVVIEPHYTERDYKRFINEDMRLSGMKYGIGIDSVTGIIIDPQHFPKKWEKIGQGSVHIIEVP